MKPYPKQVGLFFGELHGFLGVNIDKYKKVKLMDASF